MNMDYDQFILNRGQIQLYNSYCGNKKGYGIMSMDQFIEWTLIWVAVGILCGTITEKVIQRRK